MKNNEQELLQAITSHDKKRVYDILKNGISLKSDNKHYCPLLQLVSEDNYTPEDIKFFLEHGADVNEENEQKFTPLINVSYDNNIEAAKILIEHGADVNSQNIWHSNSLLNSVASPLFSPDYFVFLINNGADYNQRDIDGENLIDYAKNNPVTTNQLDKFEKIINQQLTPKQISELFLGFTSTDDEKNRAAMSNLINDIYNNFSTLVINKIENCDYKAFCDINYYEKQYVEIYYNIMTYINFENYISAINQIRLLIFSTLIIGFYTLIPVIQIAIKIEDWNSAKKAIDLTEILIEKLTLKHYNKINLYEFINQLNLYKKIINDNN